LGDVCEDLVKIKSIFIEKRFEVLPFFLEKGKVGVCVEGVTEETIEGFD